MTVNAMRFDFSEQGSVSDAERRGGFTPVPSILFECVQNEAFFQVIHRGFESIGSGTFQQYVLGVDFHIIGSHRFCLHEIDFVEGDISVQDILEFTNVAGPVIVVHDTDDVLWDQTYIALIV